MPNPKTIGRRALLQMLLATAALQLLQPPALASDSSGSGSGSSGSGSSGSGSGSSGGGSDDSGSGSDNSGSGSGGDDHEDEDDDERENDSDDARDAVRDGKAVSLRLLLKHLNQHFPGRVLDVDLKNSGARFTYRVKILAATGKVQRLRFDALTLQRL